MLFIASIYSGDLNGLTCIVITATRRVSKLLKALIRETFLHRGPVETDNFGRELETLTLTKARTFPISIHPSAGT